MNASDVLANANLVMTPTSPDEDDDVDSFDVDGDIEVSIVDKPRVFKTFNFTGCHWCDFCANIMWGQIAQGSKGQDCGFEAHKKCSEKML